MYLFFHTLLVVIQLIFLKNEMRRYNFNHISEDYGKLYFLYLVGF